ncbi:MAG: hypothetical protein PHE24_01070 [Patescibacteria group bacterium]|nr:hypothetical protein [Patescibacteria group bacterium]
MLEYLEKFNNLPSEVKQKISSGAVMAAIEELEGEYGLELAGFVIRVMVGELYYKNLTANLIIEYDLEPEVAEKLAQDLQNKIFDSVTDYLSGARPAMSLKQPEAGSPFFGNQAPLKSPLPRVAAPAGSNPAVAKPIAPIVRRAPINPAAAANYLEEDQADITAAGKITTAMKTMPQEKFSALLAGIIAEAKISFASETLSKRFQEILLSYLRGVRTKVGVKENLLKDFASGGVKMSESEADRILNIAQKKLAGDEEKFSPSPGKVTAKSNAGGTNFIFNEEEIKQALAQRNGMMKSKTLDLGVSGARDVGYDLSALKNSSSAKASAYAKASADKTEDKTEDKSEGKPAAAQAPVKNIPPSVPETTEIILKPLAAIPASPAKVETPAPEKISGNEPKRTAAVVGNKKRMEDIKPSPRVMSPIDELAYMDLVNFRRLDIAPANRVAKIEAKIALLEKEGIDKKIEGIRVWRLNPVNKTYLAMGQESIGSGKTITDIIKERKDQGLNYLSQEEFEAVMDLNNNLRF